MTCNLREIRIAIGMTQRQVAELFGQTASNVSHYENGKQELPPNCARLLIEAAAALGKNVTFDDVYSIEKVGTGAAPPSPGATPDTLQRQAA